MVDEFRTIRDNLIKTLLSGLKEQEDRDDDDDDDESGGSGLGLDAKSARELLMVLLAKAGKGKDDVVQTIAREIGQATAAMLKEPLRTLAKHQKLQVTLEFVPKEGHEDHEILSPEPSSTKAKSTSRTKRSSSGKKAAIARK